ncbi:hypothetical protein EV1_031632 [Malus domestica]
MILYGEALLFGDVAVPYLFSKQIVQAQFLICSPSRCGSFSSSSSQTPSAGMIVQAAFFSACFFCTLSPHAAGIIFACLICFSGRCGSFFGSTSAVEDEYSRAISPCPAG